MLPCEMSSLEFVTDMEDFTSSYHMGVYQKRCIEVCETICPDDVRAECLETALNLEVVGVWGGSTRIERRRMRVDLGIPHPAPLSHMNKEDISQDAYHQRQHQERKREQAA